MLAGHFPVQERPDMCTHLLPCFLVLNLSILEIMKDCLSPNSPLSTSLEVKLKYQNSLIRYDDSHGHSYSRCWLHGIFH